MRKAVGTLVRQEDDSGEGRAYALKRRLLGKPLINEQLGEQRLSKTIALGVLTPDGISSSAYGPEEILIGLLLGGLGLSAWNVLLPITAVVLFVMVLVVLSYREVVMVYTKAGGSYVVARENFGPRVAQIAALALMVDYVVTVCVQVAAGTAAVASFFPWLGASLFRLTVCSILVVLVVLYGNLRGIREAGKAFAAPTYLFSAVMILTIVVGVVREILGNLPQWHVTCLPGMAYYPNCTYAQGVTPNYNSLVSFGLIYVMLRSFANGGSSLTGIEAVSNAVSAFRSPEGRNARRVLVYEGMILGTLIAGIAWLAHATHATPYRIGVPTVISQEAKLVFGASQLHPGVLGNIMYGLVQVATALILYTGGNTSFNGFPFLASFVAEDAFLPRWLTKRGHRLVFSNGIIVLAILSITLFAVVGSNVNALVPFYALGVFTAFTMAGFGMARYHHHMREQGWRRRLVINFSAGVASLVVVLVFAIVKFTEGAWLVVVLFILGVPALMRLNRQYRNEATVLAGIGSRGGVPEPPTYARRKVFVFIDDFDLATVAGLRYARSLRPTSLRAVHFVIDNVQADKLRQDWVRANPGIPLDFVDCPDRRIAKAAADMVSADAVLPGVGVTAILPRRSYAPIVGRLLHDRTADKMAAVISRVPHAAATIVPFDVRSRVEMLAAHSQMAKAAATAVPLPVDAQKQRARAETPLTEVPEPAPDGEAAAPGGVPAADGEVAAPDGGVPAPDGGRAATERAAAPGEITTRADTGQQDQEQEHYAPSAAARAIGSLTRPGRAVTEGRVHAVEIRPVGDGSMLACDIEDATGQMTALFYGRTNIPGLRPGCTVRLRGQVGMREGGPVMINPAYELLASGALPAPPEEPGPEPRRRRNKRDNRET